MDFQRLRGDSVLDRRTFLGKVAGVLLALPGSARAQKAPIPFIGFLSGQSPEPWMPYLAAFRTGLAETGYIEGKNVAIEFRWAQGHDDRLPELAAELIRRGVAVVMVGGGGAREAKAG